MRAILASGGYERQPGERKNLSPRVKVGLVGGGYVIAACLAVAVVVCRLLALSALGIAPVDSGMAAFSDFLLFLAVFGVAAMLPTGAALFFLRPFPAFWRGYSAVAGVFALAGMAAFIVWSVDAGSVLGGVAFFRILVAPLCALAFFLSALFAPVRAPRLVFLAAMVMEIMAFAGWGITCLLRNV